VRGEAAGDGGFDVAVARKVLERGESDLAGLEQRLAQAKGQ
jgi:hypothetical protein